ncbi:MAG: hypothetical protein KAQ78_07010, partial [Candidatus Latescibacteria bacterium]|nr:hypothetical protein [Candidatus Latescibacterota bacterium]
NTRKYTVLQSCRESPKAMGHGYHGFSRIKQSAPIRESEQSNTSPLNKNLVKKQNFQVSSTEGVRAVPWAFVVSCGFQV